MSIEIIETPNKDFPKFKPIKEKFDVLLPNVNEHIPNRNGFVYLMCGAGGSGKTSMLLNMFKSNKLYRCKFDNIFYICPMSSFLSVEKHPFSQHDKVYHDLTVDLLDRIKVQLDKIKQDEDLNEYSCVIIDDMANFEECRYSK
jgi:thymidine kinase